MPKTKKQNKSDLQFDLFSETEIQSTASPESKESPSQRKENSDTSVAIFEKEEFGTVRTIEVDGKILFCGKDVASILGYTNETKALNDHCKTDGVTICYPIIDSLGRTQEARFITEGDVYRLIAHSKLKSAQKFESWIFDEVLPSISKTARTLETIEFKGNIDGLVYSKDGKAITTSRLIAKVTGKEHKHILRDIRDEVAKLNAFHCPNLDYDKIHYPNLDSGQNHSSNLSSEIQLIINDFKEIEYTAQNGQTYKEYELGQLATMQIMLRYSAEFRARFILAFIKMQESLNNIFKARVIESVLPQDNRNRQFIYIFKNPLNETVKIGVAQDVERRKNQLETGAGVELELIYQSLVCSNAFCIEKDVHEKFKEYRTFGEWFKIDPNTVVNFLEQQTFVLKSEFSKYISLIA